MGERGRKKIRGDRLSITGEPVPKGLAFSCCQDPRDRLHWVDMEEQTIEIRQKAAVYQLRPRAGETPEAAVVRELGWALRNHLNKDNSLEHALNRLGWEMVVTTQQSK